MIRHSPPTEHHIIPRNGPDIHGTNDRRNRVMLPEHQHTNRHRVFGNLEFHNQILRILEWNTTTVSREVRREIASIVQRKPEYVYVDGVWRPSNS